MNTAQAKRVLETALLCSTQPVTLRDMRVLFDDALGADTLKALLEELQLDWAERGLELVSVATGWRFQSRPELRFYLDKLNPEKPPKYTRAVMETLAIIAYKQPLSRQQVASIRGVDPDAVMRTLQARGYITEVSRDDGPGQAVLFGTTAMFLERLGLDSLASLPPIADFVPPAEVVEALEQGLRIVPANPMGASRNEVEG